MRITVSANLYNAVPTLEQEVRKAIRVARRLDPDICRLQPLYVWARCSRYCDYTGGTAVPEPFTRTRTNEYIPHPPGKITLSIGQATDEEERLVVVAHELRHIGQFYRGCLQYGYLTSDWMGDRESEADARDFERKVMDRI